MVGRFDEDKDRSPTARELEAVPAMSREDFENVRRSKEYKESHLVRELTYASLQKSQLPGVTHNAHLNPKATDVANAYEAKKAHARKLFNDPRYKVDPEYRYEVAQKLSTMRSGLSPDEAGRRVQVSRDPNKAVDVVGFGPRRVTITPTMTGPNKPEPKPPIERDPNITDLY